MNKILNISVTIILGLLASVAVFSFVQVITNGSEAKWIDVSKMIPSISLSIGVFIGWLTFTSNIAHKKEDKENSFSFEYLNECIFWFGKIYQIIEPKLNVPAEDRIFGSRLYYPKIIPEIESLLANILLLSDGITNTKHKSIYNMRKNDLKNQLFNMFSNIDFYGWSSFEWGEKKVISDKIEDYNSYLKKNSDDINHLSKFQNNGGTPFNGGIELELIYKVLSFFDENIKLSTDSRLESFKEYESICNRYKYSNGYLIEKIKGVRA